MGGFYLITAGESPERRREMAEVMDRSFERQGLTPAARIETRGHLLQMFHKRGQSNGGDLQRDSGNPDRFIAACGTVVIDGRTGSQALSHLLIHPLDAESTGVFGSYCLIEGDREGLRLRTDPLGLQLVFRNKSGTAWSSSFMAVAAASRAARFKPQALFEYVFMEMPHGRDTIVDEVHVHDCRQIAHFTPALRLVDAIAPMPAGAIRPTADLTDECVDSLRTSFNSLAKAFAGRIDSGLSGGYDSRLILSALLAVGAKPRLHVYGKADSEDVVIAKRLASKAELSIHHLDKGQRAYPSPEEYRSRAIEWLYAFDGYPADGVMGNGLDLESRMQRVGGDAVPLNGGGGEIFRNFFYLPDGRFTKRQLLWTFYTQFDPSVMQSAYSLEEYYQHFERKLDDCVGHTNAQLTRREIEWIYSAFRCRFWMARNNSVNNRFGAYLTPLFTWPLAKLGLAIPIDQKNHGRFEAGLIRALAPTLAAVETSYGHPFDAPIPSSRIVKDTLTLARPPWLRRWSFAIQSRLKTPAPPAWMAVASPSLGTQLPRMSRYFDVSRVKHAGQLNRLYTLELLGDELNLA